MGSESQCRDGKLKDGCGCGNSESWGAPIGAHRPRKSLPLAWLDQKNGDCRVGTVYVEERLLARQLGMRGFIWPDEERDVLQSQLVWGIERGVLSPA